MTLVNLSETGWASWGNRTKSCGQRTRPAEPNKPKSQIDPATGKLKTPPGPTP